MSYSKFLLPVLNLGLYGIGRFGEQPDYVKTQIRL